MKFTQEELLYFTQSSPGMGVQAQGEGRLYTENPAVRPWYCQRPVLNAGDVLHWAQSQGINNLVGPDDLHVTVCYSQDPFDYTDADKAPEYVQNYATDGDRYVGELGDDGALVLHFQDEELQRRWRELRDAGASWDYDAYRPHITLSYEPGDNGAEPNTVIPYAGPLVLGPEEWSELELDKTYKEWDESLHPRQPEGSDKGGEFASKNAMTLLENAPDEAKQRAQEMKLPPAWTHVNIALDPEAPLQATGIDSKGRKQYVYSVAFSQAQAAAKFERLKAFNEAAPKLEAQSLKDMQAGNQAAGALYLISQTGFRVGGDADTGAETQAYGASTLLGRHVSVDGDTLSFNFTGKKGVALSKTLTNKPLADYVRSRKLGSDDRLFDTDDAEVRAYLKKHSSDDFKVKDFRTWHGTNRALELIDLEMKTPPANVKEKQKAFARVKKGVAEHLGNTPAVAFASYIDPAVWGRLETRNAK